MLAKSNPPSPSPLTPACRVSCCSAACCYPAAAAVVVVVGARYLQLPDEGCSLWQDSPNEFVIADLEEGEAEDGAGAAAAGGLGGGRPSLATARSAGLTLIRDLCEAFPEKVRVGCPGVGGWVGGNNVIIAFLCTRGRDGGASGFRR